MKKIFLLFLATFVFAGLLYAFPPVENHQAARTDSPYKWQYQNLLMASFTAGGDESLYNTVTLSGVAASDSSMYYWWYPTTAIAFTVSASADSVAFWIYAEACHISVGATVAVPVVMIDSLYVNSTGRKNWRPLTTKFDENIRFRFAGTTGNGSDLTVLTDMRLNRAFELSPSFNIQNAVIVDIFDSTMVAAGSLSVTDLTNGGNGFLTRPNLADSLGTDYGIQETGTAWIDSTHAKNGAISGADLINPLRIPTYNFFALNATLGDSLRAKSAAFTSYLIANGAGIFRGGSTTTGAASADTTKGTNAAFTGYGIINGAAILRGGATITGTAAPDTLHAVNSAVTGYSIVDGASIIRGGETVTGIATADTAHVTNSVTTGYGIVNGTFIARTGATVTGAVTATGAVNIGSHFKLHLNASLPDTTGFVGGETWYSAIGDTTYIYLGDHTIKANP